MTRRDESLPERLGLGDVDLVLGMNLVAALAA